MRNVFVLILLAGTVGACVTGDDTADTGPDTSETDQGIGVMTSTGPYFATPMFFNGNVSGLAKASNSDAIISQLKASGGWGNGNKIAIDFTINVLKANSTTPKRSFTKNSEFYSPDCDYTSVPIPSGGNVEGNTGYTCTSGGDCHLIVYDTSSKKLYEMYRASLTSSSFSGGCLAVWDGTKTYTDVLRGDQCTSADAGGLPIAPLLFTADEVKAGSINHAIRFILPNSRIKKGYVRPATHATNTTGGTNAPPYGVHLRLRANYPIANLKPGAQVVARAMQKYGMYLTDGGNIALTAQSDRNTTAKWSGLLGSSDLAALQVGDFEVISHGSQIPLTMNCVRK